MPLIKFPSPFKPKELLDLGSHEDMEECILEIQPHTHGALLEPFPDCFKFFHLEIYVTNVFIELFQVQDRSPFVRSSLRFRYCKVCTNILALYPAHLVDCSLLKKSSDFSIKNIGSFIGDGKMVGL